MSRKFYSFLFSQAAAKVKSKYEIVRAKYGLNEKKNKTMTVNLVETKMKSRFIDVSGWILFFQFTTNWAAIELDMGFLQWNENEVP